MNDDESEIASAAFFILPGLLKALTILKSPKQADFLKSCISPTFLPHLPYYIIQRAAFTHDKVQAMRERSARQAVIKPPVLCRRPKQTWKDWISYVSDSRLRGLT